MGTCLLERSHLAENEIGSMGTVLTNLQTAEDFAQSHFSPMSDDYVIDREVSQLLEQHCLFCI
jgi:hypothetical protein